MTQLTAKVQAITTTPEERATQHIAARLWRFLQQRNHVPEVPTRPAFYACPLPDRALMVFDLEAGRDLERLLTRKEQASLERVLGGRPVLAYDHGGLYLQIAYRPAPPPTPPQSKPLDLTRQPSPLALPCGETKNGPLWLPLADADSILVAGARQMGKTTLLHAWIQALIAGEKAHLTLWDGKAGSEFARYESQRATHATQIEDALARITETMHARQDAYKTSGARNFRDHAKITGDETTPEVIIVDEAIELPDTAMEAFEHLIRLGGGYAIHPILGTQHPSAGTVTSLVRANLKTRIALPVATARESVAILGHGGAEKLPKQPGHLLIEWRGEMIQAVSNQVDVPAPTPTAAPLITQPERRLAEIAIRELGGWFHIVPLSEESGESKDFVNDLAKRWQAMGLLTEVQRDEHGYICGREVKPRLREIVEAKN
ncbi:MAG: hypothetical protein GVY30_00135 [Chloroflexi bacterium]|nr:hypothetical protein [Chloroflexota bacterium]